MQHRAGVKYVTAFATATGKSQRIGHRVSTSYPQVFGLSVSMNGKVDAQEFRIDP
jgi:hypothetical protein